MSRNGWTLDDSLLPDLRVYKKGASIKIELSRPDRRNALTGSMVESLRALYEQLATDVSIHRIFLTAQGKVFCAGMDLSTSGKATVTDEQGHASQLAATQALFCAIDNAPQTTIALINGPCYGGGNGLAFVNDIRIAVQSATFNLTEVRLGLSPCAISPYLLREWGIAFTRAAMLTARPVTAADLHRIGALYSIASDQEQLQGEVLEGLDTTLQACAPAASNVCKELVKVAWSHPGGPQQEKVVRQRFMEMMAPSREAKYGIGQFRKGVKSVDWTKIGQKNDSKL